MMNYFWLSNYKVKENKNKNSYKIKIRKVPITRHLISHEGRGKLQELVLGRELKSCMIFLDPNFDLNDCGKTLVWEAGSDPELWDLGCPWPLGILVSSSITWVAGVGWTSKLPSCSSILWKLRQAGFLLFLESSCWMGLTCKEGRILLDFSQRWKPWCLLRLGLVLPWQEAEEQLSNCWKQNQAQYNGRWQCPGVSSRDLPTF